jgi:hypothetical protein
MEKAAQGEDEADDRRAGVLDLEDERLHPRDTDRERTTAGRRESSGDDWETWAKTMVWLFRKA